MNNYIWAAGKNNKKAAAQEKLIENLNDLHGYSEILENNNTLAVNVSNAKQEAINEELKDTNTSLKKMRIRLRENIGKFSQGLGVIATIIIISLFILREFMYNISESTKKNKAITDIVRIYIKETGKNSKLNNLINKFKTTFKHHYWRWMLLLIILIAFFLRISRRKKQRR